MLSREQSMSLIMIQKRLKNTSNEKLNTFATFFKQIPKAVLIPNICWDSVSQGDREAANQLLEHVINANWDEIEKIVNEKPYLMFLEATAKDIDEKPIRTSPLKYAFAVLDTYTWKLCHSICQKNAIKQPEYLENFQKQASSQEQFINLQLLFNAYVNYLEIFFSRSMDINKIGFLPNDKELNEAWIAVGKMQRDFLPRHMLKEMCRKGFNGWPKSSFDVNNNPRPQASEAIIIKNALEQPSPQPLLPNINNTGLGVNFSLAHGDSKPCLGIPFGSGMNGFLGHKAKNDLEIITKLCLARMEDFTELLSSFESAPSNKKSFW